MRESLAVVVRMPAIAQTKVMLLLCSGSSLIWQKGLLCVGHRCISLRGSSHATQVLCNALCHVPWCAVLRCAVSLQVAYADGLSVLSGMLVEMRALIDLGLHWSNQVSCCCTHDTVTVIVSRSHEQASCCCSEWPWSSNSALHKQQPWMCSFSKHATGT